MRNRHLWLLGIASLLLWSCRGSDSSESLRIQHPDDPAKQVEYFVEQPPGSGPWLIAGRGYLAVAVSQPGYGGSSGPADYCGPFTQHAVAAVIARLKSEEKVAKGKLVIEGISRGAVTAGLIAARDPSVSGLVLISGVYDFAPYVQEPNQSSDKQAIVKTLREESGGTPAALESRSVLRMAGRIKASTLILNGAKDDRTSPDQAPRLADTIVRSGGKARAIIYPDFGHQIPVDVRNKEIDPLIDSVLGQRPQ